MKEMHLNIDRNRISHKNWGEGRLFCANQVQKGFPTEKGYKIFDTTKTLIRMIV